METLSDHFDSAPTFKIMKQCPVEIYNTKVPVPDYVDALCATVIQIHVTETPGDVLVFLAGEEEVLEVNEVLEQRIKGLGKMAYKLVICPLDCSLPVDLLAERFEASAIARKVILVADITMVSPGINGVKYVIDSGFCKIKSYKPFLGIGYQLIHPISKASANERAEMCGFSGPGKCYRLYTLDSYINGLQDHTDPEIQRVNLASAILTLKAIGVNDLVNFDFLDPPPSESMIEALSQIYAFGALNTRGELTTIGKRMAAFPLDPMLSKMIVASEMYSCSDEAISIVSMLSVCKSIFCRPKDDQELADRAKMNFHSGNVGDHIALLNVLFSASILL